MADFNNIQVSSLMSVKETICTDSQVCGWFMFLILRPEVKKILAAENGLGRLYLRLKTETALLNLNWAIILGLLAYYRVQPHVWVLAAAVLIFFIGCGLSRNKKLTVSRISVSLIKHDFKEEQLSKNTLYQLGEYYSRKFHALSLTDMIFYGDRVYQEILLVFAAAGVTVFYLMNDGTVVYSFPLALGTLVAFLGFLHSPAFCRLFAFRE